METASVFNIERFATEDGPGIRTVVFLKGCGLRCRWCANPESQSARPQLMFNANLCTGCGRCVRICPAGCIELREGFGYITDEAQCTHCGVCVDGCYAGARSVMGELYTLDRLEEEVLRDAAYYRKSGGGITFSGGEPLLHHRFIQAFARRMKRRGIPVLVETCGHVPLEAVQQAAGCVDAVYYDFKHTDPQRHRELTGAGNQQILANLQWLCTHYEGFLALRYPYIPGCNDREEDVRAFLALAASLGRIDEVWFLPYHRLGLPKYQGLGRTYPMGDTAPLKMKDIAFLTEYAGEYGLHIRI